jgi:hypothetical protein
MIALECAKEAEHIRGALSLRTEFRRDNIDILLEDKKARVVGRSRCQVARQLARGAATADDDWQHGADTNHSKAVLEIPSSCNKVLPEPLLDGGQGKRGRIGLMVSEQADGVGVGETKQSDWTDDTEDGDDGTMEIMGEEQLNLFAGALHANNSRESIRSSDTHPNFNGDHLRASELTPPPHGEIQTVNRVSNPPRGVRTDRVGIK